MCAGKQGLPIEIADDPLLDLATPVPEAHPNAEESALCRADPRAPTGVPARRGRPSVRVRHGELTGGDYDVTVFGRPPERDVSSVRSARRGGWTSGKTPATGASSMVVRTGPIASIRDARARNADPACRSGPVARCRMTAMSDPPSR